MLIAGKSHFRVSIGQSWDLIKSQFGPCTYLLWCTRKVVTSLAVETAVIVVTPPIQGSFITPHGNHLSFTNDHIQ